MIYTVEMKKSTLLIDFRKCHQQELLHKTYEKHIILR